MAEKFIEEMHNFLDSRMKSYKEALKDAYENGFVFVPHHDMTRVAICQYLVEMGYMIDINPLSSFYKGDSAHKYILTEDGKKSVEDMKSEKMESKKSG